MGLEQATVLAEAYLARIKRSSNLLPCPEGFTCTSIRDAIQAERCHLTQWSNVSVRADLWSYGEPATLPLPDSVPANFQNHAGPRFHFPVFDRGMWIATINVAAYATGLSVGADGRLDGLIGGEFRVSSVPCSADAGVPAAPEQAVRFAALRTGRKVTQQPILLNPGGDVAPGGGRWKLQLDGSIIVRSIADGSEHTVDVIYTGMWSSLEEQATPGVSLRLFIAKEQQPDSDVPITWPDENGEVHTSLRMRNPDYPLLFIEVEVVTG